MKNMKKIVLKENDGVGAETSTSMQFVSFIQENVCNNIGCLVVALVGAVLTIFIMNYWMKKLDDTQETDQTEHTAKNKEGAADEDKKESSEDEGSEEDLPWLLQKAPSKTSLSDVIKNKLANEKQSECSGSDKSQESVKMMKKGHGCGDSHVTTGVRVITADADDYLYMDDDDPDN
ncbi:hypothetical protein GE061_016428 [Apolygus lucorum]|uniref:Uncharacterized protein n=1 Tax=Apolygus lucorum TaxID=248454 RepID=A0A6A4K1N9_APOLU|nr:hypothetical protein GE061_016428 [Apolygus lucorum]